MPRRNSAAALAVENEKLKRENEALKAWADEKRSEALDGDEEITAPLIREAEKPRASGTVTIACKWPGGIQLVLQMCREEIVDTKEGKKVEKRWIPNREGKVYHVFGPSMPAMGGIPDGYVLPPALEGGYALTPGIPAAFWEEWLEQNKLAPYVINNLIFAMPERSGAKHKAEELKEIKSGAEPLSRQVDAQGSLLDRRMPKPATSSLARITYDAERDSVRGAGPRQPLE